MTPALGVRAVNQRSTSAELRLIHLTAGQLQIGRRWAVDLLERLTPSTEILLSLLRIMPPLVYRSSEAESYKICGCHELTIGLVLRLEPEQPIACLELPKSLALRQDPRAIALLGYQLAQRPDLVEWLTHEPVWKAWCGELPLTAGRLAQVIHTNRETARQLLRSAQQPPPETVSPISPAEEEQLAPDATELPSVDAEPTAEPEPLDEEAQKVEPDSTPSTEVTPESVPIHLSPDALKDLRVLLASLHARGQGIPETLRSLIDGDEA